MKHCDVNISLFECNYIFLMLVQKIFFTAFIFSETLNTSILKEKGPIEIVFFAWVLFHNLKNRGVSFLLNGWTSLFVCCCFFFCCRYCRSLTSSIVCKTGADHALFLYTIQVIHSDYIEILIVAKYEVFLELQYCRQFLFETGVFSLKNSNGSKKCNPSFNTIYL